MAQKTVLCHFYNEEWILPFWLKHHREIFDHGIMIDYHSTDRSCEIIREYCPTWQIQTSRNHNFAPQPVDDEVMDYERDLQGWRIALNATEFMVGNYDHLNDRADNVQHFLGQWMLIDMERRDEPFYLEIEKPVWDQRWHGYGIVDDFSKNQPYGSVPRAPRSIHNHALRYTSLGRHYPQQQPTFSDLAIFYMGYASLEPASIGRKMQIQTQIPGGGVNSNHKFTVDQLMDRFRKEQQPMSRNLREELKPYVDAHTTWVQRKRDAIKDQTKDAIRSAINTLTTVMDNIK